MVQQMILMVFAMAFIWGVNLVFITLTEKPDLPLENIPEEHHD